MGIGALRRYHKFIGKDGNLAGGLKASDLGTNPTTIKDVSGKPEQEASSLDSGKTKPVESANPASKKTRKWSS
jgi:hypothetical protein